MFYGKGAGKNATASAVVADIMDCAKHLSSRKYLDWCDGEKDYVVHDTNAEESMFVRIKSDDYDTLNKNFDTVLGGLTEFSAKNEFSNEISFITKPIAMDTLNEKLASFNGCSITTLHTLL